MSNFLLFALKIDGKFVKMCSLVICVNLKSSKRTNSDTIRIFTANIFGLIELFYFAPRARSDLEGYTRVDWKDLKWLDHTVLKTQPYCIVKTSLSPCLDHGFRRQAGRRSKKVRRSLRCHFTSSDLYQNNWATIHERKHFSPSAANRKRNESEQHFNRFYALAFWLAVLKR